MIIEVVHPWQRGPTELIEYAIDHLHREDEFHLRVGFLLLDLGVETLLKAFLTLPEEVTGARTKFYDRKKAADGSFHELVEGVKAATPTRLRGCNLTHVEFYHHLRNTLYHQGNGITVPLEHARGYARLALDLLKALLDVELPGSILEKPDYEEALKQQLARVDQALDQFREQVELVIERVAPELLLPSMVRRLRDLAVEVNLSNLREKQKLFGEIIGEAIENEDIRTWVMGLVDEDVSERYALENASFLFSLLDDPFSLYLLIIGEFVLPNEYFQIGGPYGQKLEEIYEVIEDEEHILAMYEGVKSWRSSMLSAVRFNPNHPQAQILIDITEREIPKLEEARESLRVWFSKAEAADAAA